jgi:F-type H+-transporting ATPase subunit a
MHELPVLEIGGFHIDLSTWIMIIVSSVIVFVIARLSVRKLSVDNPGKLQNMMEWVVEFVKGIIASAMDWKHGKPYINLALTLILFIFVSNLLGLPFAIVTEHTEELKIAGYTVVHQPEEGHPAHVVWWKSPTADLSVTMGLAVIIFVLTHYLGMRKNRKHYLKHYVEPYAVFFPLNLIKEISKPITLGMRLFANIFAGEILIATIVMAGLFGIPIMIAWQGFSIFVGAIQAFLFTMLSMVYIAQATVHEEH